MDGAATGLASLCFLAADHTPAKPGPYRQTITKALDFLVGAQKPDGDLRCGRQMYTHGIATLALGEAAAMTGSPKYAQAAIRGARFLVKAQHPAGGWRYNPRQAGDTSVVGWQVMALHSVERIGWKIPKKTRKTALAWLRSVSRGKHKMLAGYVAKDGSPAVAAEGAFARLLLGRQFTQAEQEEISSFIMKHPPGSTNSLYYYYYASLALMQLQNETWTKWNAKMRDYLVKLQKPDGSWGIKTKYGSKGGRVYTTALSTLTLEVYYRYLPMYKVAADGQAVAGDK